MSELEGVPERIWLQYHGDDNPADYPNDPPPAGDEVSWCWEPIFEHDIEYIRLDKYKELEQVLAEVRDGSSLLEVIAERDEAVHDYVELNARYVKTEERLTAKCDRLQEQITLLESALRACISHAEIALGEDS